MKKLIYLILLSIYSVYVIFALGYGFFGYGVYDLYKPPYLLPSLQVFVLFILLSPYKKLFWTFFALISITAVIYFPVGMVYGSFDESMFGSFIEADVNVDKEFFTFIPRYIWYSFAGFIVVIIASILAAKKVLPYKVNHYIYLILFTLFASIIAFDLLSFGKNHFAQESKKQEFSDWNFPLFHFYANAYYAPTRYFERKKELMAQLHQDDTWHIISSAPQYQNYVLVMGESMRQDYLSAYGFPLDTTPFMRQTPGLLIDGMVSPSFATMGIWPNELALEGNLNNNIVNLANKAGFYTAWISNQGVGGFMDKELTGIAWNSQEISYTQRGSYVKSIDIDDRMLLPKFKKTLNKEVGKPKFIALHLMGSHMDFCDRVKTAPSSLQFLNKDMSCYVQSLWQTDNFLAETVKILRESGQTWSLIYLSDHGLIQSSRNPQTVTLIHNKKYKQSFTVPLIRINFDDTEHIQRKLDRSGFDFMIGLTQWMNIQTEELQDRMYDFFDGENDPNVQILNGWEKIPFSEVPGDDPFIRIGEKDNGVIIQEE